MKSYERLSGLDASFLGFETPNAPMHVAVTALCQPGPLTGPGGGVDIDRVRTHVAGRLEALPRFRQRLLHLPVVRDPIWIDDDRFDLARHVRHASLPLPGSPDQLRERAAELLERPLDRRRPLWEIWAIEGLEQGGFALLVKVHHCIVDGIAGIGMLAALLDVESTPSPMPVRPWYPRPAPTNAELVRDELDRRARGMMGIGRAVGRALGNPAGSAAGVGAVVGNVWRLVRTGLAPAPEVCFNRAIGPHRRLAWRDLDLAQVKTTARRMGGTVNDAVLTVVSGALATALRRQGEPVPREPLRAVVPVSIRTADEMAVGGNRVSLWLVPLPLAERSVPRRFARIRAATEDLKRGGDATGGAVVAEAANWAGGAIVEQAARLIATARLYNLIVTNVPGPPVPLYLSGCRLTAVYPHLPLFEQQGIGIALLSYAGRLHVGITADWNLGALLDDLAAQLDEAFADLVRAADVAPAAAVAAAGATTPLRLQSVAAPV